MKIVFAHDHRFSEVENEYYSTGGLSGEVLKRYIDLADELTIVARSVKSTKEKVMNLSHASVKGTRFVTVPNHKSMKSFYKINNVKKILEEEIKKTDFVIARISSLGNLSIRYAKKHNKPYFIEVVGCPWDALWNYSWKGKLIAPFSYMNLKRIVSNAPYVLYVTNEFLQKRYPTNGKSINCSNVSLEQFDDSILKRRILKIENKPKKDLVTIGTVAAINVKYKGQECVIKALAKLKNEGKDNYVYELVGGGDNTYLYSVAKKYDVLDQVKFLGTLPHNEVFKWFNNIDIYAQPSKQEGLPRALIEAMSKGVPSIGARTAGIPELLDNNYIFSNSKNRFNEIADLIYCFNKNNLIEQAIKNYNTSKEYDKSIIDKRRRSFLNEFLVKSK